MPLLEIYKDNEISASAGETNGSRIVSVTDMRLKLKVTVPNIAETFPTCEEAEKEVFCSARTELTKGSRLLDH